MSAVARRGHVYLVQLTDRVTAFVLVVSNNRHNAAYDEHIAVQVTANKLHEGTAGAVRLGSGDPVFGYAVCRDLGMVRGQELVEDVGELSMETMVGVERALRMVLGL